MSASVIPYRASDETEIGASNGDADEYPRDLDQLHAKLVRWFEEAELASADERDEAEIARDYRNCVQWTSAEQAALKARGQPITTYNYVSRKVELLCGLERKARTDPKAFPRTPTEEDRADAATQALRYIHDDVNMPIIASHVYEEMLIEGMSGAEMQLEDDGKGGANIRLEHVPWDRIWRDPHARRSDFLDARYKGIVIWMDKDQLEETYPDAEEVVADSFAQSSGGTYDDRPGSVAWTDNQRQRCRVVQCHWVERDTWWSATYTRAGIVSDPQKSRFRDRHGKSACALLLTGAYVDRDNRRFGIVRDLRSPQDAINKRESKALHLLSVHQAIYEQGAVADIDKTRRELAKPDGLIEINPGFKFEIHDGNNLASGHVQLLQHATAEMQAAGPNASMSGTDPRELSGRAILAQQAGGAAANEPLADALRQWKRRVFEMAWMAARESWSAGKWVRVTDDLGATRWVGINRAVTVKDALAEMPEEQRMVVMQRMQLQPGDPRLDQVIKTENDISDLEVDIVIEEGIDVPAQAAENFQTLVQLAGLQPGLIPGDVLIAASSLKNKDDLLARMKEHMQAQQQEKQAAAPLMKANAEAEVAGKQAKAAADAALAKERNASTVAHIHGMHAEFSAPPYGQPFAAPPDSSSPPNATPGPEMMAAHAGGGLVKRVLNEGDFTDRLYQNRPMTLGADPRMAAPLPDIGDRGMEQRDSGYIIQDQSWVPMPGDRPDLRPLAAGGPVVGMTGGDPAGPDDGFITAKQGEYVLNRGAVARYGQGLLDALNSGAIDPKMLQVAAAHADADLRNKQRQGDVHEATVVQRLAQAAAALRPPPPKATP